MTEEKKPDNAQRKKQQQKLAKTEYIQYNGGKEGVAV